MKMLSRSSGFFMTYSFTSETHLMLHLMKNLRCIHFLKATGGRFSSCPLQVHPPLITGRKPTCSDSHAICNHTVGVSAAKGLMGAGQQSFSLFFCFSTAVSCEETCTQVHYQLLVNSALYNSYWAALKMSLSNQPEGSDETGLLSGTGTIAFVGSYINNCVPVPW